MAKVFGKTVEIRVTAADLRSQGTTPAKVAMARAARRHFKLPEQAQCSYLGTLHITTGKTNIVYEPYKATRQWLAEARPGGKHKGGFVAAFRRIRERKL